MPNYIKFGGTSEKVLEPPHVAAHSILYHRNDLDFKTLIVEKDKAEEFMSSIEYILQYIYYYIKQVLLKYIQREFYLYK